jgi:hypothetical protein
MQLEEIEKSQRNRSNRLPNRPLIRLSRAVVHTLLFCTDVLLVLSLTLNEHLFFIDEIFSCSCEC